MKRIDPKILSIAFSNKDLCTRCGTCAGVCPTSAISFDEQSYPVLAPELCTECGLCAKTCPGGTVNFQHLTERTFGETEKDVPTFDGHVTQTYVGQATDAAMRQLGAGGGVVTALLSDLLRHGDVAGCLVTRMKPDEPWKGESFIARSIEDLTRSQGSRYSVIPHNAILAQVRFSTEKFAYVGLPCHIHGLRLAFEHDPALRDRIPVVIGLFCGGALETNFVPELLRTKGLGTEEIEHFEFRGGEWPGKMRAHGKDGHLVDLHEGDYKDGAYIYSTYLYSPMRCLTCLDGSSHFSDISISDVWTRDGQGEYRFREHSRLLARTASGVAVIERAVERGSLRVQDVSADADYRTHQVQTKRKRIAAPLRIVRLGKKGVEVPHYDRQAPDDPTPQEQLSERLVTALHYFSRNYWFRYLALKILTSPTTAPLIAFRRYLKRRKYTRRSKQPRPAAKLA